VWQWCTTLEFAESVSGGVIGCSRELGEDVDRQPRMARVGEGETDRGRQGETPEIPDFSPSPLSAAKRESPPRGFPSVPNCGCTRGYFGGSLGVGGTTGESGLPGVPGCCLGGVLGSVGVGVAGVPGVFFGSFGAGFAPGCAIGSKL
jgi:hypothetical protein